MSRGAILSFLFAGLITGGSIEFVTNQSDAHPTEAEQAQAAQTALEAIDMVQSAEAVPGSTHYVAAYGEGYWINALLVKLVNTDGRDFDVDVNIRFVTMSSEVVAQNEAAIRDALIGVLEARTLKEYRDGSAPIVPELQEAIDEIVGRDIVRNVTIQRMRPLPPSRRSR